MFRTSFDTISTMVYRNYLPWFVHTAINLRILHPFPLRINKHETHPLFAIGVSRVKSWVKRYRLPFKVTIWPFL